MKKIVFLKFCMFCLSTIIWAQNNTLITNDDKWIYFIVGTGIANGDDLTLDISMGMQKKAFLLEGRVILMEKSLYRNVTDFGILGGVDLIKKPSMTLALLGGIGFTVRGEAPDKKFFEAHYDYKPNFPVEIHFMPFNKLLKPLHPDSMPILLNIGATAFGSINKAQHYSGLLISVQALIK